MVAVDYDHGPSSCSTAPARGGRRADPHADDEPRRPLAGARLARPGAQRWGRGKPDLMLALALIHHVTITANVPVREFVDWLASLGDGAGDRVPHPRGRDGQDAARRPSATGLHPDYERERLRARAGRGVRGRAQRAARVGHPPAGTSPVPSADEKAERGGSRRRGSPPLLGIRPPRRPERPSRSPSRSSTCSPTTRSSSPRAGPHGERDHRLLPPARGAAARGPARDRAAGRAGERSRGRSCTWCSSAGSSRWSCQALKKSIDASDTC